jgi:hypothetical protein
MGTGSLDDDPNADGSGKRRKGREVIQALSQPAAGDVVNFFCPYKKRDPQIDTAKKWKSRASFVL